MRSMRVFLACALATLAAAAVVVGISSCGDKVQGGLTDIDIKVSFESDLRIKRLRFAGFLDQTPAFPLDNRPHAGDSRDLDPADENLIVLLPDMMGEKEVFVRVTASTSSAPSWPRRAAPSSSSTTRSSPWSSTSASRASAATG